MNSPALQEIDFFNRVGYVHRGRGKNRFRELFRRRLSPVLRRGSQPHVNEAHAVLRACRASDPKLGLYLHIPFCRKHCKFCYFRVYTDKNARDVENYVAALLREVELYRQQPLLAIGLCRFVYFGGGTPSISSASQLQALFERLRAIFPWEQAEEVTFECEPGTLQQHKLVTLKELGVTRLSLGIENFSDAILEANGRAHLSAEIYRAYGWARELKFPRLTSI